MNFMQNTEFHAELTTILDYIRWGTSQLRAANVYFGHGTDNAWDEAVYLVLHALHLPQDIDRGVVNAHLTPDERCAVSAVIMERARERKPAPYITHTAYFAGLEFYVDERVLIPRSPLAELIEQNFAPWIEAERVARVLDIGTGSGCIAIASAYAFPDAVVDAIDISPDALRVAKINVEKHHLTERVHLIPSDLFSALRQGGGEVDEDSKYDVIISNPPYVASAEMASLPSEYAHEPELALVAGKDGLALVDRLLEEAKRYLAPGGILIVEVGNSADALIAKYPSLPFIWLDFTCGESEVFLLNAQDL